MELIKILNVTVDKYYGWKIIKYVLKYDLNHYYRISFDVDDSFMWKCVYNNGNNKQICDIEYENGKFISCGISDKDYIVNLFVDIPKQYLELLDLDINSKILEFTRKLIKNIGGVNRPRLQSKVNKK